MAQDLILPPTASPPSPHTFAGEVVVTLSLPDGSLPGTEIYYDTEAGAPTYAVLYTGPIRVNRTTGIHAIARYLLEESEGVEFTYTLNEPPSAAITYPTPSQILRSGTSYNLMATASDPEGTPVTVTYQVMNADGGGWTDIGTSTSGPTFTVPWTPTVVSGYDLRARVEDGTGLTGTSARVAITVTEPNHAPVAFLTNPAPGTVYLLGNPIAITANAFDTADIGGSVTRVEFRSLSGLNVTDNTAPYSATYTPTAAGTDTLWAVAFDNHTPQQSGTSARVGIVINAPPPPNRRPVVNSLAAAPGGPFTAPAAFAVNATATDSDGTVAYVQFYRGGAYMYRDSSSPFSYPVTNLGAGNHAFTARAFDDDGDSSVPSAAVTVIVAANQAPTARTGKDTAIIVHPTRTLALSGATSSDPEDGNNLIFAWTAPSGVSLANPATAAPTATFPNPGEYPITLTVTDRGSPPLSGSHVIRVYYYQRPEITSRLVDSVNAGAPYSYTMTATGFPAPSFTVGTRPAWLNLAGNVLSGTAPATGGNAPVTFTATNPTESVTRTLALVVRQGPVITLDLPETDSKQEGQQLNLTVAATGIPAPNSFQWQRIPETGVPINIGGNSPTFIINALSLSDAGAYRVIVRNGVNPPDTSRQCRLTVRQAINISSQPLGITVQSGRSAVLQVRATGAPPLMYQWFRGTTPLGAPARDSNLVLNPVRPTDAGLYRARVTNTWSDTNQGQTYRWSDTARITVTLPKIDRPKTTPAAPMDYGREGETLTVRIYTDTPFTYIRYTLDGTNPTNTYGTVYDTARKVVLTRTSATLKVMAYRDNYQPSDMYTGTFNYVEPSRAAKPTATPVDGLFGPDPQLCQLSTSTMPGGVIRYTLNGENPKTAPHIVYTAPFLLTANTTVIAYTTAPGFTDSDTLVKVYTLKKIVQTAQAPTATPPEGSFTDSLRVTLFSATDSATLYYTLDGSPPETSPSRMVYSGPITLRQTAVLRSVTTRPGWNNSPTAGNFYARIPGPIVATPTAPKNFEKQLTVKLSVTPAEAKIYYTLNDSVPLDARKQPVAEAVLYTSEFVLDGTKTVTAVAIQDTVVSKVFRFAYTRIGGPLNTPVVSTGDKPYSFRDTLRVSLLGTNDAAIRYTLNGDYPSEASPIYAGPFLIDTTTTLQAIAYHPDFLPSKVLSATFTLVADTPSADPPGGNYGSARQVTLKAVSRKTPIRYTVDGTVPGPDAGKLYQGETILINKPTVLQAVAFANGVPGPMRVETYNIFGARDTVLAPGETFFLQGGYTVTNPDGQGLSVRVRQGPADSLALPGFKDVHYALFLSPAPSAAAAMVPQEFPTLTLARTVTDTRGVYRVSPEGHIYYISGEAMVPLAEAGAYFMGTDTTLPAITYLGESLDDTGATLVGFKVEDNVYNLLYTAKRSDNPAANVSDQSVFSGSRIEFRLKHPAGSLKALNLQVSVTDYSKVAFCPPGGQSFLPLSQKLTNVLGPEVWNIGKLRDKPHDLVGIPFQLNPALTVSDLGDPKSGARVEAYIYVNPVGTAGAGTWRKLAQNEPLEAGRAYWVGSRSRVSRFARGSAITKAQGIAKFKVALRTGWNQVANPHLETLYWPFPRDLVEEYTASRVKGLWVYAPESPVNYLERDAMEPWKGYFVYNHGGDTLIELSPKPLAKAAQKPGASPSPFRALLSLSFGDAPAVRLGATLDTRDGLGHEDEGVLPSLDARQTLRAVRQGRGLSVDFIRFEPDRILQWRILPRLAPEAAAAGSIPPVKLHARSLPEGYEVWALSRARSMRFRLAAGDSLPATGLPDDTLLVAAGPAAKLAEWELLKGLSESAPALDLRVGSRAGVPEFRIDLPASADIRATVWTLRGASLGELDRSLSAGRYRFTFADFRARVSHPAPGVHFLRVEIRSQGRIQRLARKIVFRP